MRRGAIEGTRDVRTVHATSLVLTLAARPHGLILTGASGAGKSALAMALLDRAAAQGRFARLVADDRVALSIAHGRLLARCPTPLRGRIEMRGVGLVPVPHLDTARLHAHVALVADAERMPDASVTPFEVDGTAATLPRLELQPGPLAALRVEAWLRWHDMGASSPVP